MNLQLSALSWIFPSKWWAKGHPSDNLSVSSACSCQGKVACSDCMWVWSPPKYDCWIRHCWLINITTVYTCTEAYVQAHAHTYMHKLVHTHTHACTHKFRHTHAQMYAGIYRHARVRTQAHMLMCAHTPMVFLLMFSFKSTSHQIEETHTFLKQANKSW